MYRGLGLGLSIDLFKYRTAPYLVLLIWTLSLSLFQAHPAGFLAEALRGNMGFLITRTVPPIFCKGCKGPIKAAAYACKTYAC